MKDINQVLFRFLEVIIGTQYTFIKTSKAFDFITSLETKLSHNKGKS